MLKPVIEYTRALLEDVRVAEEQIKKRRIYSAAEVKRRLKKRYGS